MNLNDSEISNSLQKILDSNGYSFQYSVARTAHKLSLEKKSPWLFFGTELPVTVNGRVIHIDLILKHRDYNIYLVAECKRVNPKMAIWSFVRSPYTFGTDREHYLYFDFIMRDAVNFTYFGCSQPNTDKHPYHIGFELKTNKPGDTAGNTGTSAINDAVAQGFRSASGLVNFSFNQKKYKSIEPDVKFLFIPVVFTTAEIHTADCDISTASITDGFLPKDAVKTQKGNWIWFNSNRSDDLLHGIHIDRPAGGIYQDRSKEVIRSVAIVNSEGIEDFFNLDVTDWIKYYASL